MFPSVDSSTASCEAAHFDADFCTLFLHMLGFSCSIFKAQAARCLSFNSFNAFSKRFFKASEMP